MKFQKHVSKNNPKVFRKEFSKEFLRVRERFSEDNAKELLKEFQTQIAKRMRKGISKETFEWIAKGISKCLCQDPQPIFKAISKRIAKNIPNGTATGDDVTEKNHEEIV